MKNNTFQSTAIYTLASFLSKSVGFLLLPVYSKYISNNDFGIYSLIFSFVVVFSVIIEYGYSFIFPKYYSEATDTIEKNIVFNRFLTFILINTSIIFLFLIPTSGLISDILLNTQIYKNVITIAFAAISLDVLQGFFIYFLKNIQRSKTVLIISLISASVQIISSLLFIIILKQGFLGIFYSQIISSILAILFFIICYSPKIKLTITLSEIKNIIIICSPILLTNILGLSIDVIDRFILNSYVSKNDIGLYSFIYRISTLIKIISVAFISSWIPLIINIKSQLELQKTLKKTFTQLVFTLLLLVIFLNTITKYLFYFNILDTKYQSSYGILIYLLFAYSFYAVSTFYYFYSYREGKSSIILLTDSLGFIANIILNIYLIPIYGIYGAAIATMLSYLLIYVYLFIYTKVKFPFQYEKQKITMLLLIFSSAFIIQNYYSGIFTDTIIIISIAVFYMFNYYIIPQRDTNEF